MLHTKFHENWFTGSEVGFLRIFTIYDSGGHLVQYVTNIILIMFYFLVPKSLHTKFGKKWLNSV